MTTCTVGREGESVTGARPDASAVVCLPGVTGTSWPDAVDAPTVPSVVWICDSGCPAAFVTTLVVNAVPRTEAVAVGVRTR